MAKQMALDERVRIDFLLQLGWPPPRQTVDNAVCPQLPPQCPICRRCEQSREDRRGSPAAADNERPLGQGERNAQGLGEPASQAFVQHRSGNLPGACFLRPLQTPHGVPLEQTDCDGIPPAHVLARPLLGRQADHLQALPAVHHRVQVEPRTSDEPSCARRGR